MTAEVAIMNCQAVVLAADSAVTLGNEKVYNSANKLFMLSKKSPVGVMVFGNAEFMDVPWETILKCYRALVENKTFGTVEEWARDFLDYLEDNSAFFPEERQDAFAKRNIALSYYCIKSDFLKRIKQKIDLQGQISDEEQLSIFEETVDCFCQNFGSEELINGFSIDFYKSVKKRYSPLIEEIAKEIFRKFNLSKPLIKKLIEIANSTLCKENFITNLRSGVVFAGFGDDEFFPSLVSYYVDGICMGKLRHMVETKASITYDQKAFITSFAQSDMVQTFMNGINPILTQCINKCLNGISQSIAKTIINGLGNVNISQKDKLIDEIERQTLKAIDEGFNELNELQRERLIDPVVSTIAVLPKEELASMAESLVNLTCLRRRVTSDVESVGGAVDVAVISKGDGFVWIKRKHYFSPELNHHFFRNYYNGGGGNNNG